MTVIASVTTENSTPRSPARPENTKYDSASANPAAAATAAITATHSGTGRNAASWVVSSPTMYPPPPKNAACPNVNSPPYPQIRSTETANAANSRYRPSRSTRKESPLTKGTANSATTNNASRRRRRPSLAVEAPSPEGARRGSALLTRVMGSRGEEGGGTSPSATYGLQASSGS